MKLTEIQNQLEQNRVDLDNVLQIYIPNAGPAIIEIGEGKYFLLGDDGKLIKTGRKILDYVSDCQ